MVDENLVIAVSPNSAVFRSGFDLGRKLSQIDFTCNRCWRCL